MRGLFMRILNLYAGLGGNRKLWENCEVTAVEYNEKIADAYSKMYPHDSVIVGDAQEYLLKHFRDFDFIWASPPCQTNSKARFWYSRNSTRCLPKLPDLTLYQYKIFLEKFYDGLWVIENVIPYYDFLIKPTATIGHNAFWANFNITKIEAPKIDKLFKRNTLAEVEAIKKWLGIEMEGIIYSNTHSPTQVLRNCVHPEVGLHIYKCAFSNGFEKTETGRAFKKYGQFAANVN
ncbi:MAG: DNA cytosine methyltransferase [Mariniphaga sp.]|nr:DNA cytosine methyltransferase [Mariniphaga sp.]